MGSYRALMWLWAGGLSLAAVGVATLQLLGPPRQEARENRAGAPAGPPTTAAPPQAAPAAPPAIAAPPQATAAESSAASSSKPAEPAASLPATAAEKAPLAAVPPAPARASRPRVRSAVRRDIAPAERLGSPDTVAASQQPGGYIGVFGTDPDGRRTFKSNP